MGNTVWPTDKWVHVLFEAELGTAKVAHVSLDGGTAEDHDHFASPLGPGAEGLINDAWPTLRGSVNTALAHRFVKRLLRPTGHAGV